MKISTKARYAIMAMLELAMHEKQGPLNLTEISKSQGISLSYLEQLFANLRDKGLVKGRRGPGGGYRIAREIKEISVADIMLAVDDSRGANNKDTLDGEKYPPAKLWEGLSARIEGFLSNVSLADCMEFPDDILKNSMVGDRTHSSSSNKELEAAL
ncbi:MAG: Rrf2 family transcriptional regulator [Acidiferrobacterales bacterium]